MKVSFSTHLWAFQKLCAEHLRWIAAAGFHHIELWGGKPHFFFETDEHPDQVASWLDETGLRIATIHLPFYNEFGQEDFRYISLTDSDRQDLEQMQRFTRRLVDLCPRYGTELVVLHPVGKDYKDPDILDRLRRALEWFVPYCRQRNVSIALENIMIPISRASSIVSLCREFEPAVGLCLDVGHAQVDGGLLPEIQAGGPHIYTLHVHDNNGKRDYHQLPGQGTIDWTAALAALARHAPNVRFFTFELMLPILGDAAKEEDFRLIINGAWDFWREHFGDEE